MIDKNLDLKIEELLKNKRLKKFEVHSNVNIELIKRLSNMIKEIFKYTNKYKIDLDEFSKRVGLDIKIINDLKDLKSGITLDNYIKIAKFLKMKNY